MTHLKQKDFNGQGRIYRFIVKFWQDAKPHVGRPAAWREVSVDCATEAYALETVRYHFFRSGSKSGSPGPEIIKYYKT